MLLPLPAAGLRTKPDLVSGHRAENEVVGCCRSPDIGRSTPPVAIKTCEPAQSQQVMTEIAGIHSVTG